MASTPQSRKAAARYLRSKGYVGSSYDALASAPGPRAPAAPKPKPRVKARKKRKAKRRVNPALRGFNQAASQGLRGETYRG